jgi:microcystin degradation protein MlrC
MKIAVAGFQHETNSFAPTPATYADFVKTDGWPGLTRGEAMFDVLGRRNLGAAGFFRTAAAAGHAIAPLVWAQAQPSGPVTADAFERVAAMIVADLADAMPVDAVYLDLHGAMVTAVHDDGEGELIRRVRALVGVDVPIAVSLDLHASVTPAMIDGADLVTAFRTYPHVDIADTGARAAVYLDDWLRGRRRPAKLLRKPDFLIPLTAQCSMIDPARALYALLEQLEAETGVALSFTPGFPPADIAACGPAVFGFGPSDEATERAVGSLFRAVIAAEPAFGEPILAPAEAVARAMREGAPGRPVVLADTQDNPGAGGTSDTMGVTRALIEAGASGACVALVTDPEAADLAHRAGVGQRLDLRLGGRSGVAGDQPLSGRFVVEALGDGAFTATGPMYGGAAMRLGPMARLSMGGVDILVASQRQQAGTQAMFRHLGVEPADRPILALKSSVHFRADFQAMAAAVLVVAAPGLNLADPAEFPYRHLPAAMRRRPTAV